MAVDLNDLERVAAGFAFEGWSGDVKTVRAAIAEIRDTRSELARAMESLAIYRRDHAKFAEDLREARARPTIPSWTKERPTVAGDYRIKQPNGFIYFANIDLWGGRLYVYGHHPMDVDELPVGTEFSGPIPAPPEPRDANGG